MKHVVAEKDKDKEAALEVVAIYSAPSTAAWILQVPEEPDVEVAETEENTKPISFFTAVK